MIYTQETTPPKRGHVKYVFEVSAAATNVGSYDFKLYAPA